MVTLVGIDAESESVGDELPLAGDAGLTVAQLRRLDPAQLRRLAADIRRFIVRSVARNGGHLGSNLGTVELTLALHRVFESPHDAIIWDTGHQAYGHKLLTGRAGRFDSLRREGGLSGYPNRAESAHDFVENSHASTALSYAYGLARGRMLRRVGDAVGHHVIAVVGDGALTGGMAYEALNNIGASATPVIVVLNDNGRSYAPTISAFAAAADGVANGAAQRTRAAAFFESLGLAYDGPIDGHDVIALEQALRRAQCQRGPVVVHVHTTKGRGYRPALEDDEKCLHDVGPFDPDTGIPLGKPPGTLSHTEAFSRAILREAAMRPEVVVITAAMPGPTGLIPFADRYPDRFFDVGIAEQHAVTAAAGMAMAGLRPVVAIYSTFLNRAWDQVYYDVGLHRLPVVFCLDRAGITGEDGPSHHGLLDLALLTKVPNMTVLAPSSYEEVGVMLHDALDITDGPVAIRWPKTEARAAGVVGSGLRARLVRSGTDVCLVGVGKLVAACEEAAEHLEAVGLSPTVWDARVVAPVDPAMVEDLFRHRLVLVAEDGVREGGFGTQIGSALRDQFPRPVPRLLVKGAPLEYIPHGRPADLLARFELDGAGIAKAIRAAHPCTMSAC